MSWIQYKATDKKLGSFIEDQKLYFRVWAPGANKVELALYENHLSPKRKTYGMSADENGVYEVILGMENLDKFYTYILNDSFEITDPYSIGVSVNSLRSYSIDPGKIDPVGWGDHKISGTSDVMDTIIYEVHIKDFTVSEKSGVKNRGKYAGMVEKGAKFKNFATGIDHLKELGVTHIHLMPIFDFLTVNENPEYFYNDDNYNWGYDPEHYNVPEGSYSTKPEDPYNRIHELKKMIMTLHEEGFKVIMDVVYNHTYRGETSNFNLLAPEYYYRMKSDGTFSDGSGCGNELATERPMVKRFIIESLKYWMDEYKIDGFRFDLMALIDVETVKEIVSELRKVKSDVFIYGEPWTAGETVLPDNLKTTKGKQQNMEFALLNDGFRNSVKGDNNGDLRGFIQGNCDYTRDFITGLAGSIYLNEGHIGFAAQPKETINFINSHDNLILNDKMKKVFMNAPSDFIDRLNRMAFASLFIAQGIPLVHAGNEFLRSKDMKHNTYNEPLSVNGIDWSLKERNYEFFKYFKDLIRMRKKYPEFRLSSAQQIKDNLKFCNLTTSDCHCVGYTIKGLGDSYKYLFVAINSSEVKKLLTLGLVKDHILKKYGNTEKDLCISKVFDMYGIVEDDDGEKLINPHAIEIEGYSLNVFIIAESCETI
ncbi:type I pullulanase [Alkalibacter mobilis]|uniref:type I pullulanase n=1 Tax=Alkalibacter mobilis TaxID=2787712 RepID=UPI00189E20FA|nr:type I pullulanase [Alkalibacter mobilis]MBF7095743.1 type I pullulanase [Alkalibacter mobilis]